METKKQLPKRKHWIFSDWQKYDPVGLNEMKNTKPEKYKSLYGQQFRDKFKHTLKEMKNWTYNDYLAKDPEALQWIKDNLSGNYKQLYDKQYNSRTED